MYLEWGTNFSPLLAFAAMAIYSLILFSPQQQPITIPIIYSTNLAPHATILPPIPTTTKNKIIRIIIIIIILIITTTATTTIILLLIIIIYNNV
jgi:hypothetical protein